MRYTMEEVFDHIREFNCVKYYEAHDTIVYYLYKDKYGHLVPDRNRAFEMVTHCVDATPWEGDNVLERFHKEFETINNPAFVAILNRMTADINAGIKKTYYTACHETGDIIDTVHSYREAVELVHQYDETDKAEGTYTPDFYEVEDADHHPVDGVTRTWKVYGAEDHSKRQSFGESVCLDWSTPGNLRIFEADCADKTGTDEYVLVRITRNTYDQCQDELDGQLSDGFFENARYEDIEEVTNALRKN